MSPPIRQDGSMTDQPTYTPPAPRTQDEIDALVAFIRARVKPLRDRALSDTDEYKVSQALLDITAHTLGVAQSVLARGDDPSVEYSHLALISQRWDDHPDFQDAWNW
jgi:hypothetical protein